MSELDEDTYLRQVEVWAVMKMRGDAHNPPRVHEVYENEMMAEKRLEQIEERRSADDMYVGADTPEGFTDYLWDEDENAGVSFGVRKLPPDK